MRFFLASGAGRIALLLSLCLVGNTIGWAAGKPMDAHMAGEKIRQHGIGKRVRIVESDGAEVKGKIVAIDTDSFQVQPKQGAPVQISYTAVKAVHGELSKGAKIGIVVGAAVVVVVIVAAVIVSRGPNIHFSGPLFRGN